MSRGKRHLEYRGSELTKGYIYISHVQGSSVPKDERVCYCTQQVTTRTRVDKNENMPPLVRILLCALGLVSFVAATTVRTPTPPMGWNSYNYYGCSPTEAIVRANAAGLVRLGLRAAGYDVVTPDCGWSATYRDTATGELVWNPATFPSGGRNLSDYVHGLGLRFGMYSGAGHFQCGSTDQPASLGMDFFPPRGTGLARLGWVDLG